MRFHILAVPHAITIPNYSMCAFTQKILKICKMLTNLGHEVIHYGHEESRIAGTNVPVTTNRDLIRSYGAHNWRTQGFPNYSQNDHIYCKFRENVNKELNHRKQKGDFLLCPFGGTHKPIADNHPDMIIVEPGIGYPDGKFAPYKVFESYAILHAYLGERAITNVSNDNWYDVVIPNYFDTADFDYSQDKDDYLLFLGRVYSGKGIHIAVQLAEELGLELVVAGAGKVEQWMARTDRPVSEYVREHGVVGPTLRRKLLSRAKAVICASTYLEPFCGVQVEAFLSGTPVISSDYVHLQSTISMVLRATGAAPLNSLFGR